MILWRAGMRSVMRHPLLAVLAVLGVALGVTVVTAVDRANESAQRAFRLAAETVAGRATHQIVGGPSGLSEELYRDIRVGLRLRGAAPVVAGHLQISGVTFQLIGIDPFSEAPVRSFSARFADQSVLTDLMTRPGAVLMLRESASERDLRRGGTFSAEVAGAKRELRLAGFLDPQDRVSRAALASVLVCDIATAQELLGQAGRLTRIDLVLPEGEGGEKALRAVRAALPPEAAIIPAGAKAGAMDRMTRAFRLNLTAMSLLALVVGMFLIYNTMTFSVIRRRRLIGMLRALGVSRREVFVMICAEALIIGVAGTLAGLAAGVLLGTELTRLVTRTINDLYFVTEVRSAPLLPGSLLKGALLGVVATLAAAVPAALEATSAPPRAVLSRSVVESQQRRRVPRAAALGLFLLVSGCALLLYEAGGIVGGFSGLFILIIGYTLLVPGAVLLISRLLLPIFALLPGSIGKMAARGVGASLSRTGVATAALVVAVAAGIGVGIMVGGFRLTVQNWLQDWLQADLYLTSVDRGGGRYRPPLDPALVRSLMLLKDKAHVTLSRRVLVDGPQGGTEIFSVDVPQPVFARYPFKKGDPGIMWGPFSRGEAVLVSEPYGYRHDVGPGDSVTLRTARGAKPFPIAGVVYDYGSDAGIVIMSRRGYASHFDDESVDGMSFTALGGVQLERLRGMVSELVRGKAVTVVSNRELRRATVEIFDRTFAITGVLRLLIMLVAFVGILSALMAMQVERARELAVMRAVGLTPGQVCGVVCGETVIIGAIAGLLSLPLGIIEALVLIYVVNLRSFGWTMQFAVTPRQLGEALILSVGAALVAGIYPSMRIARTPAALALKEED